jgi:energy-converting hydrogenase Eha subunit A
MNVMRSHLRQLGAIGALSMLITFSPALCAQIASSTAAPSATANAGNPFRKFTLPSRKPIPVQWKIAIVLAVVVIASGALWISIRVWGSANLFDRQYRFPAPGTAALRLGGNRSGGHSASIKFGRRAGPEDAG